MWSCQKILFNKRPDFKKLYDYGFSKTEKGFEFSQELLGGDFSIYIFITKNALTEIKVIDCTENEEYALVYIEDSSGSFVGKIRSECEEIVRDICEKCYEPDIFKSEYAKLIIEYIKDKYNSEAEYLWKKFPNNAIFRQKESGKWFAALLTVEKNKLGIGGEGTVEIIDLKEKPQAVEALVDGERYLEGYHMNKKHWYTILLDGSIAIEEIFERINNSFNLV